MRLVLPLARNGSLQRSGGFSQVSCTLYPDVSCFILKVKTRKPVSESPHEVDLLLESLEFVFNCVSCGERRFVL